MEYRSEIRLGYKDNRNSFVPKTYQQVYQQKFKILPDFERQKTSIMDNNILKLVIFCLLVDLCELVAFLLGGEQNGS